MITATLLVYAFGTHFAVLRRRFQNSGEALPLVYNEVQRDLRPAVARGDVEQVQAILQGVENSNRWMVAPEGERPTGKAGVDQVHSGLSR